MIELLLAKGYKVYGTYRRISSVKFWRLEKLCVAQYPNLPLAGFDLTDIGLGIRLLQTSGASEIYNLAAQSFVGVSLDQPYATAQITGVGALNLLEAICIVNPNIRYYQSSTSGMFSKVQAVTLDESTSFYLRSPYGVANLYHRDASESRREQVGDIVASPPWDDRKGNIP